MSGENVCKSCGKAVPEMCSETSISGMNDGGWKTMFTRGEDGSFRPQWYCPPCWEAERSRRRPTHA